MPKKSYLILLFLLCGHVFGAEFHGYFDSYYKTKYISKGRDVLDGHGIYWGEVGGSYNHLSGYVAVGEAEAVNFTEIDIGLSYDVPVSSNLGLRLSYSGSDCYGMIDGVANEFDATVTYTGLSAFTPKVKVYYDPKSDGFFILTGVKSHWAISDKISVAPYIEQGLDYGYVSQKHDGKNHLELGVVMSYRWHNNLSLYGLIAHTISQSDLKHWSEVDRPDQTFGGIKISWYW